jgi:hypothetical protein
MSPIETRETFLGGEVVLAATQSVKRFESIAHGFGSVQLTVNLNVAAVSAGSTHIVGATLNAIGTVDVIINDCKTGNAPILSDGRTLQRLLCQANRRNGILSRAEVEAGIALVFVVGEAMSLIETRETFLGGEVVLAATQIVKLQGAVDGSRIAILLQAAGSSVSGDGQDSAKKESKGQGKELRGKMDGWMVG